MISTKKRRAQEVRARRRLHICHIIHRLDYGGLQNGLVNVANGLDPRRFRHTVICLKDATDFKVRLKAPGAEIIEIGKRDGKDPLAYLKVYMALRRIRPDVVHTRNLPAVDMIYVARLSGVKALIHSEHGLDVFEIDGKNRKYNRLRRMAGGFVRRFVAMSDDLAQWLENEVRIPQWKIRVFYNGVDTERFRPGGKRLDLAPTGFADENSIVLGTVGRLEPVKDQVTLVRAFLRALELRPGLSRRLRLVMIGDGDLRREIENILMEAKASHLTWMPGFKENASDYYGLFDVFVLPSKREGISNTLLEAQSCGLPVIATDVGGTPEIVAHGRAGMLVPPGNVQAMAEAILRYVEEPALMRRQGLAARERMEQEFSMAKMLANYEKLYDDVNW
jgi:sugar transferase (PEP-CTERM/EpsH1 system associated)